jgi:hypothetical protein
MRALPPRAALRALCALVILPGIVTACGGGTAQNPFDGSTATPGGERIRIEVQNLNFNDATVWALRSSQRIRVGRVTGKTDQMFDIAWNTAQPIAIQVDVVSGRGCRTNAVAVEPNSRVWVTIPSDMGLGQCRIGRR